MGAPRRETNSPDLVEQLRQARADEAEALRLAQGLPAAGKRHGNLQGAMREVDACHSKAGTRT